MRMDNLNKCSNHNSLTNVFTTLVTITLLTFGALTIDPLLVVATGEVEGNEENRNVDSSISNGNDLLSSSPLPSPSSQRSMNTDISGKDTSGDTDTIVRILSTQSSLQDQELGSLIEGTTSMLPVDKS